MNKELPDDIYNRIEELSEQGDVLLDEENRPEDAIAKWEEALALLPDPKQEWDAAAWLYASIGAAKRYVKDLEGALIAFRSARQSGDAFGNPYILICLGATLYDLGKLDEAVEPLLGAYMVDGEELFEDFGGPYLLHLKSKIDLSDRPSLH